MTDEQITRVLDAVEADMRRLESRINSVRAVLRDRIDPYHRRRDLGYWEGEEGPGLRPQIKS